MDDYSEHLVRFLGRNGVETALCGQQHEAHPPTDDSVVHGTLGYDVVPEDPGPADDFVAPHELAESDYAKARAAAEYVREDHDDPFFLSVGLDRPHRPFPTDPEDLVVDPNSVQPPGPIPDVPAARRDMAGYITAARYVDDCVGHVYDALEAAGMLEDTVFLFTTDHGIQFKDGIADLFESGIGVSLIGRFPDGPRGDATDALVSQIDLFPTLCSYFDLEVPEYVDGVSMCPLIRGETDSIRSEAYSELTYHAAYEPKRCVRTDRYKYIRRFDESFTTYVLPNIDESPTKQFLLEHGLGKRERPREALYDLYHDPNERDNLVDDPAFADVYDDLAGRLRDWMQATEDPLLQGPVPKPEGARITRRECPDNDGAYEEPDIR
jgi:arylsulfatase A-like enzyme